MPRWARVLTTIILFSLASSGAQSAAPLPDETLVVEHFRNVVFVEDRGTIRKAKPLVRWATPIVARMHGADTDPWRPRVEHLFAQLHKLTGLPFRLVDEGQKINMAIIFKPTEDIRRITKQPKVRCAGTMRRIQGKPIYGAGVYISTDDDFRTRHCIVEEITQVLGLTNDSETALDTIFKEDSQRTSLSLVDQILVRTLYDKRLRLDMSAKEAMPIATAIIGELMERLRRNQGQ